jgi:hypothetical protein
MREEMLDVVEQDERALAGECRGDRVGEPATGLLLNLERLCDDGQEERGIANRRQRDPPQAVREALGRLRRRLEGEPRLPGAAGTREREQSRAFGGEKVDYLAQLSLATQKTRRGYGEIRPVERLQRRKSAPPSW